MATVLLPQEFKESNMTFTEPRKNQMGGSNVLINYATDRKTGSLIIQTPRLRAPFGADRQESESGGASRYNVNLTVNNEGKVGEFFEVIKQIEQCVLNTAVEKSEQWFGKKKSKEVVEELMRSVVKYPKQKDKYDPTLKVRLPSNDKGPQFTLEDSSKTPITVWVDGELDLSTIPKGCELVAVIQCTGVYFIGKTQFGIGFKLLKARVFEGNLLKNIDIIDDDNDNEGEEEDSSYVDY